MGGEIRFLTIDIYRQRIGCFIQKSAKKTSSLRIFSSCKSKRSQQTLPLLRFIVMFALAAILSHPSHYYEESSLIGGNISQRTARSDNQNLDYWVDNNFYARYTNGNKRKGGLKIMHWNAGGGYLKNKIPEIENIIGGYRPHLFGISESCFKTNHDISDIQIPEYEVYLSKTLENPNLNVSRLAVYVHKDIANTKLRSDLMSEDFSSIWLEIRLPRQRSILVGNAYRDWQYLGQDDNSSLQINAQHDRFLRFVEQWELAIGSSNECHLLGDLNLNFLEYSKPVIPQNSQSYKLRTLIKLLFDRILPLGAIQCVAVATRTWPNQEPSGLDHYFTTNPRKLSDVQVITHGASDHKIIFATRYSRCFSRNQRIVKKRSYKNFDTAEFLVALRSISWWRIYSCNDVNLAVEMLTEDITKILDTMAPIKVFQVRTRYAPWISCSTKEWMKLRDEAQRQAGESNLEEDWIKYKRLRNKISNILKTEKKLWQAKKLDEAASDMGKTWRIVKSWLGWASGGPPTQLSIGGLLICKPYQIAQCMNEYFTTKVRTIVANLPQNNRDPLQLINNLMQNRTCSFSLQAVHPDEVDKIISKLKSSKSCGLDNIDSFIIKVAQKDLVPVITHIVNLSISQQIFPTAWKTAKIIPLHKKNEVTDPRNYSSVALLAIFSKILERAIFQQIVKYLESNHLLHPSHHGFRKGHNTATALLEMSDNWIEALDNKDITATVMLDLSAAFDVVDPGILLEKLKIYGFEDNGVNWLNSYLTSRYQQVYVDGSLSEPLPVVIGVPQGSILGPLLYTIFTNDLPEVIHQHDPPVSLQEQHIPFNLPCKACGGICCFADDSTFSISDKDPATLEHKMNLKYKEISSYMSMNRLALNTDKTHVLIMASAQQHNKHGNFGVVLNTGAEIITPSDDERLLGAQVSNNFLWNAHIFGNEKSMVKMFTSRINASFKTRKMIANGLVMSRIVYLIQVYGNASEYLLRFLQVLQNKAARVVTRLRWGTETATLLRQVGWLSVKQLYVFHSLILVFKMMKEGNPVYLKDRFRTNFAYQTRQATGCCFVITETPKSEKSRKSFVHNSTLLWNSLPVEIRKIDKIEMFRNKLKEWIKLNVPI